MSCRATVPAQYRLGFTCPALTRNVGVEVVAGTQGPLVVGDMPAAEMGLPVPAACTAP